MALFWLVITMLGQYSAALMTQVQPLARAERPSFLVAANGCCLYFGSVSRYCLALCIDCFSYCLCITLRLPMRSRKTWR